MANTIGDYKIPEEVVEEIRLRSDIVDTISEYVQLQRKGKNYLGLCPFHSEKTPSFTVTPEKQIFYCFGCHTGGNVFSFLMKKENWSFVETVESLADKHGVIIPKKELSPREKEKQTRRHRWEEIHEWATGYFHEILLNRPEGELARSYLKKRGIDPETIQNFRLGYAPDRWDGLLEAMGKRGVSAKELEEAGLALERSNSEGKTHKHYDRFRKRVMFPIMDHHKRTIAFGGRVLDDSLPKYMNSPETAFFNKGHHLYGMHRAHQGIREKGFAMLAEGYMDVIALQKAGFFNAVASLGTALTKDQAKLLRRYTGRIVIVYDSDQAGTQATLRAGEITRDERFRVDVLSLTQAKDPDEFLNAFGAEAFQEKLNKADPFIQFKYNTLVRSRLPLSAPEKQEIVSALASDILKVDSPVEREGYERFLSLELGLTLEAIQLEIARKDRKNQKKPQETEYFQDKQDIYVKNRDNIIRCVNSAQKVAVSDGVYRAEQILLGLMLENLITTAELKAVLGEDFWKVPDHKKIFQQLENGKLIGEAMVENDDEGALANSIARIMMEEIDLSKSESLFQDCIKMIRSSQREITLQELQEQMVNLEKSGDLAGAMALLREIGERLRSGEK